MGRKNRQCYLCGESYKYCGSCSNDRTKPAFLSEFHSESCKKIFDICTRFNMGMMSKAEAKEALLSCDLSNKENFKDYVKRDLEKIFAEEPKTKRGKRADVKPVDEIAVIKEVFGIESDHNLHEVVIKTEE